MEAVRGFVQRVLGKNFPSPEVAAAVQAGTITGPYRPEEFSAFSIARRDGGRIARLVIEDTCDGDEWERTNLRSIVSLETAYMLGSVAGEKEVATA
jgi:hypothetical protein